MYYCMLIQGLFSNGKYLFVDQPLQVSEPLHHFHYCIVLTKGKTTRFYMSDKR